MKTDQIYSWKIYGSEPQHSSAKTSCRLSKTGLFLVLSGLAKYCELFVKTWSILCYVFFLLCKDPQFHHPFCLITLSDKLQVLLIDSSLSDFSVNL